MSVSFIVSAVLLQTQPTRPHIARSPVHTDYKAAVIGELPARCITMASTTTKDLGKGSHETMLLKANITDQLNRLLTQLEDLEELRDELDDAEYTEEREETLSQLREFQTFLDQMLAGNMTLVDEFGAAQQAIQAAISQAFKTPEVIRLFANKDSVQLRSRLATLGRDFSLKAMSQDMYNRQAVEVLLALRKMGEKLSVQEEELLNKMGTLRHLEAAAGDGEGVSVMSSASAGIKSAERNV
jgi:hypothetical protein